VQDAVDCPEWIVPFHLFKLLAEEVLNCCFALDSVCGWNGGYASTITCTSFSYFKTKLLQDIFSFFVKLIA
jgi:hypothetical protein